MTIEQLQPRRVTTCFPELVLAELTPEHARAYYQLVDRNRVHLTKHGDYSEVQDMTLDMVVQDLAVVSDPNLRFGIWLNEALIGRVDLSPRQTGHYVIGYWLGGDYTGNGYATTACSALMHFAGERLAATDIYAGVTKGNVASERLLNRLGFCLVEDRGSYTLFRRRLSSHQPAPG